MNAIFVVLQTDSALFAVCEDNLQRPTNKCGMIHIHIQCAVKILKIILNERSKQQCSSAQKQSLAKATFYSINTLSIFAAGLLKLQ